MKVLTILLSTVILACSSNNTGLDNTSPDSTTAATTTSNEGAADSTATLKEADDGDVKDSAVAKQDTSTKGDSRKTPADLMGNDAAIANTPKKLKDVYKNYFLVGVAINPLIDLTDAARAALIKTQFSYICAKRDLQPYKIHPRENVYDFAAGDMLVNFAQENNMKVLGDFLAYSRDKHMPDWFYKQGNNEVSKEVLLKRLKDHITTVLTHYKGKIYTWNVVDEAITSSKFGSLFSPADRLYKIAGEDYITKSFEYARAADPGAKLFYNDFIYDKTKSDNVYDLVKKWKQGGVPIDGIGIQCHYGIDAPDLALLQRDIDRFSALGLEVQITELDVSIYKRNAKIEEASTLNDNFSDDMQNRQAMIFKQIFDLGRRNKGKLTAITLFGADDAQESYLTNKLGKKNFPYIFDANKKPKKAFNAITNF